MWRWSRSERSGQSRSQVPRTMNRRSSQSPPMPRQSNSRSRRIRSLKNQWEVDRQKRPPVELRQPAVCPPGPAPPRVPSSPPRSAVGDTPRTRYFAIADDAGAAPRACDPARCPPNSPAAGTQHICQTHANSCRSFPHRSSPQLNRVPDALPKRNVCLPRDVSRRPGANARACGCSETRSKIPL